MCVARDNKRERDRIRARKEENRQPRIEASKKYRQSEKGMQYFANRAKVQKDKWIEDNVGLKTDLIYVDCCLCKCKQVKRVKKVMGRGYKERCSACAVSGCLGLKITVKIKDVVCKDCNIVFEGKAINTRCPECRRKAELLAKAKYSNGDHRKRARKYGCIYEPINKLKVYDRDEWKCYLCGIDVVRVNYFVPNLATLDHVKPMSKGGSHTYDNVRCCCVMCNSAKGNTI
jgi:hypothetical protein